MNGDEYEIAALQSMLQKANARWQAAPNKLTVLPLQAKLLRLGYRPGPNEPTLVMRENAGRAQYAAMKVAVKAIAANPTAIDWRNFNGGNYITDIKNQGNCGSCVSFGTTATVEGALRVSIGDPNYPIDLSEAYLFYCIGAGSASCGNGWWVDPALNGFRDTGVPPETCYPYTDHDQDCNPCADWASQVTKISAWHSIGSGDDMKAWLASHGPLVTCFTVYDDFYGYHSGVYHHVDGQLRGGHCVSCVGYSDVDECWICKNSWAADWGDNGFFRIGYGECGIDATMWAVDGFSTGVWQSNKHVVGLWTINENRNAYVFIDGIGWKKISPDNDNIFFDMLSQLAAAKATGRPINFFEVQDVIKQIYVF
jgi:C1A family cysteine protease